MVMRYNSQEGRMLVYDTNLDTRAHKLVSIWKNTDAKKMFGGVCYLLNGNMFSGVYKEFLILRLGNEASKRALELSCVKPFNLTGRPMKGWVMIAKEGTNTDEKLEDWLNKAKAFAQNLPPKSKA
jgi:TfoX/Sxy family transcriptional regulator of competence genes